MVRPSLVSSSAVSVCLVLLVLVVDEFDDPPGGLGGVAEVLLDVGLVVTCPWASWARA